MEAVLGCNTLRGLQPAGQTARSDIQVQVECSKHIVVERELVLVRAVTSRARHTDKRTNRCSSAAECEGCTSFPVRVLGRSILSRTRSCRRVGKAVNAAHATAAAIYVWCAVQVPTRHESVPCAIRVFDHASVATIAQHVAKFSSCTARGTTARRS